MLATGLAVAACQQGRRVRFTTLAGLATELQEAESRRELPRVVGRYARTELVVLDELGHLALPEGAAELVFQVISQRNERGSLIVTSNLWRVGQGVQRHQRQVVGGGQTQGGPTLGSDQAAAVRHLWVVLLCRPSGVRAKVADLFQPGDGLVSELSTAGDQTTVPGTHVAFFVGMVPCDQHGQELSRLVNNPNPQPLAEGLVASCSFSQKPAGGYADYHHKMTT